MSCFMVINGSCSTNMYAWQLSFNFSSMVWGGHGPVAPPLDPPLHVERIYRVVTRIMRLNRGSFTRAAVVTCDKLKHGSCLLMATSRLRF